MPRQSKRLRDIHEDARKEFDEIISACQEERHQAQQDRRFAFVSGAQWEGGLGEQFANKPRFEVNKILMAVKRAISEYRNNRITVNFEPMDGGEADNLCDTLDKLYRADEERSSADEAYDTAFTDGIMGGMGAIRFRPEYEDEEDPDNDYQRICIEPIVDADVSVYFSLDGKRYDKSDASRCFVIYSMPVSKYREKYDDDPSSWPREIFDDYEFDWYEPDVVYLAELYEKEEVTKTIHIWENLDGEEEKYTEDELEEKRVYLEAIGSKEVRTRDIKTKQIHQYLMSGSKILKDHGIIAGKHIPIAPFYGMRTYIENKERFHGMVRPAIDSQRLKNMQISKLGEIAALSPREKPIFTPEQTAGHEDMWAGDNIRELPYLHINPIDDATGNEVAQGPVGYTKPPQVPPAMAALLQITEEDIKELLGNTQQGEEISGNISTETAHLISNRLDMQIFIYMSNFAKTVKRGGEIWLSQIQDICGSDEKRKMKGIGEQGESSQIEIMRPMIGPNGENIYENDLSRASRNDVHVEVGPSSTTRKESMLRSLFKMIDITEDPQDKTVLGSAAIMNIQSEGMDGVKDYFRQKLVRMGVEQPNEEERRQLEAEAQAQQPDPEAEYLKAAAENEAAQALESQADVILKQAKADESRVKAAEIAANIEREDVNQVVETVDKLGPRVEP